MNPGLHIEGLTAGYGSRAVIENLTLPAFPPGSTVAVLGPNAAGKSTFLKALAGLRPSGGKVWLNGDDLNAVAADARQRQIGYLPQSLPIASKLLAYELVLSAGKAGGGCGSPAELEARVEAVLLDLGLEELAFRPIHELSGGKRQLVGIAQVLVRRPRLLLLDEPTSALDLRWQLEVLAHVISFTRREHALALIALHDLNLALRFCDTAMIFAEGRVLACGSAAEVLTPEIIVQAYGMPARIEKCSQGLPIVITGRTPIEDQAE